MAETSVSVDSKNFFERNTMLVFGIGVGALVLAIILGVLLYGARELQVETLQRFDKSANAEGIDLPGPKNKISKRSQQQIAELLAASPHVLGGWVSKLSYNKTENPIIYYWARVPIIDDTVKRYKEMQESGKGYSSDELNKASQQSLRNTEEAKTGLIKCGSLDATNLPKLAPRLVDLARGVCRATIPPFDADVNLAVVVIIDIDGTGTDQDIQQIRRTLLQLQIDIFNRDYQGRETWAKPISQ